jgi:trigger factor
MKFNVTRSEGLVREVSVIIPVEDIRPVYSSKLTELSKDLSIPGFRKGKAPASQVEKRFGTRAFHDAANYLIQHTQQLIVDQEKYDFLGNPKINVSKFSDQNSEIEYSIVFNLKPDMPEVDFSKFKSEKYVVDVSDKEVVSFMEDLFKEYPRFEKEDNGKAAKLGNAVKADVEFIIDGKSQGVQKDTTVRLNKNDEKDLVVTSIIGMKAGEEKTIDLTSSLDEGKAKSAECRVKILAVLDSKKVVLDDEFAKELGVEDLTKLKEAYEARLKEEAEGLSHNSLKRELLDYIDQHAQFDVPEDLVHSELHSIAHQIRHESGMPAVSDENHDELHSPEFEAEYKPVANRRVRLGLMISDIGAKRKVSVSQQELQQEIYRIAVATNTPVEQMFNHVRKNPDLLPGIQAPIFENKVILSISSELKLPEKKVSLEEMRKHAEEVLDQDMPESEKSEKTSSKKKKAAEKA